ncbi:phospholipase D domain protein [Dictyocaulus viviparus]|uniref:Phospholipase D domain protein n=1 Tax=Dictyocaulus viviparus TaxID=29172 RepID=A0A0D8Y3E3_DICVI|nr:phospholipase D domain protein [Dictyocaulus viviparus]
MSVTVGTLPVYNVTFARPVNLPTYEAWLELFDSATQSIRIAAFYWDMNSSQYPTAELGRQVYARLAEAGQRGVNVQIAQDLSKGLSDNKDSEWLSIMRLAEVRTLNLKKLLGFGVMHSKFIIVDLKHVYIGSANMDWKSLTEVKELGLYIRNCPHIAIDLFKIFEVYWLLAEDNAGIPGMWPNSLETVFNLRSPLELNFNGVKTNVFISSSPEALNPAGREHDLEAILSLIASAERTICIAVMTYLPQTLYMGPYNRYWPDIDDAIRMAAFNGISVRLLISHWSHSRPQELEFLRSLLDINDVLPRRGIYSGSIRINCVIDILRFIKKLFTVPSSEEQQRIPFARMNHNKYMVTDKTAYVGTSNWVGDYFISTAGVGVAMTTHLGRGVVKKLQDIFDRDWDSVYATDLWESF